MYMRAHVYVYVYSVYADICVYVSAFARVFADCRLVPFTFERPGRELRRQGCVKGTCDAARGPFSDISQTALGLRI